MNTLKYNLPAKITSLPERTVVRIPVNGITMAGLLKEIKKQGVPTTTKMRLVRTRHGREARFEYPTSLVA